MRFLSWLLALALALVSPLVTKADQVSTSGVTLQDEGTDQGRVQKLNCTGTGVACSKSGAVGTINVSGGGSGYATIQNETTPLTQRATVNFTGAGVDCVDDAGNTRTNCTIAGGAGASWTTVEIDFGVKSTWNNVTTVVDAGVSAASKIIVVQAGTAATGKQADDNDMEQINCNGTPGTGQFILNCMSQRTVTHGAFKVHYVVN